MKGKKKIKNKNEKDCPRSRLGIHINREMTRNKNKRGKKVINKNHYLTLLCAEQTSACADSSMASFLNDEILDEAAAAAVAAAKTA